jgi:hypothetical protein
MRFILGGGDGAIGLLITSHNKKLYPQLKAHILQEGIYITSQKFLCFSESSSFSECFVLREDFGNTTYCL